MGKLNGAYIEWIDSETNYGWRKLDPRLGDTKIDLIRSFGIVVYEDKNIISLSTCCSKNGNYLDPISIPKCSVRKIKRRDVK